MRSRTPPQATLDDVVRRLDVLIALASQLPAPVDGTGPSERIRTLHGLGLEPTAIANIVGKPNKYVWTVIGRTGARRKARTTARG